MTDVFSIPRRSEIMSRIRSTGTSPETALYAALRSILGPRTRIVLHNKAIRGTPDFYVKSLRLAIFADGCFFHGCPKHGHMPKSNSDYWRKKIARNIRRDRTVRTALRRSGISVWSFWEHDLSVRRIAIATQRIARAVALAANKHSKNRTKPNG